MIKPTKPQLIFIVGPTAVGKTNVAIALAERLKTVILSADSRQCYREMSIGTAKPTSDELNRIPHYFINSHSVEEDFSAGDFEKQAKILLNELFEKHQQIIVVGGSGLFVDALNKGLDDLPKPLPGVREKWNALYEKSGIEFLQSHLLTIDPAYYTEVDLSNPQRLIRAIEVFESTGKPFSFYRQKKQEERPFSSIKFALNMDREVLYQRINVRVDQMAKDGLLDEVRNLIPYRNRPALLTVGYREVFEFLDENITWDQAIDQVKQNTRRYAKRQITWFKKDVETVWIDADPSKKTLENMLDEITKHIFSRFD